jgi:ribokinase
MKILNFGSCNIDYVYEVEHIVQRGETLAADKLSIFPGGKGLNQSIAMAKAGAQVYFAGCIGEDGTMLESVLKQAGVDIHNLLSVREPTGQAIIQVDKNGDNSIVIYRGANGAVTKEYIDKVLEQFDRDDILLLQNEISNLLYLIEKATEKGMKIILNPSPFESVLKSINLNNLYCIVLNETEAMQWTGSQDPYDFLLLARKEYPQLQVVLTFGENGSVFLKNGEIYRQQAFKVSAVDTTAAGDTFTGYFVAGLYSGLEITEIFRRSAAAAAIAVSKKGASSSIPTYEEVEHQIGTMQLREINN